MIQLSHYYSLNGDWQQEAANRMGGALIRNKITVLPHHLGNGISYATPVMEGISIILLDATFKTDVLIKRMKSDHNLYILQFDLSDEINAVTVSNPTSKIDSSGLKSGFSVLHTSFENEFKPIVNQRIFALRLLVDKNLLLDYITAKNKKIKNIEKKILFYNHINGSSKILINSLKQKHVFDLDYDSYIRGISLKIFANFIETYTNPTREEISKIDRESISVTKDYLLNNLYNNFPSLTFLSKMAKMSLTKYKVLFKKIYNTSPNQFFMAQKMALAQNLLKSGTFYSTNEIMYLLNYQKFSHLSTKYFEFFKKKPSDDFVKKEN